MLKQYRELLQATMKSEDTEEWLDVWFTRPIGLFFALIWKRLGVHPNAITILSIFLGMGAAWMFYHTDLWHNVAGIVLLMLANFCDSTDGQLARMTGQKTLLGRVLDGFAGDVWFFCIYAALCLRMMPELIPGTDMVWGFWIWVLGYVAGILCHTRQASLADYYRQIHLLFLKGREGSELDTYESQHAIYESLPKKGAMLQRLFYYNYQNYCKSQERRTPEFQEFRKCLENRFKGIENVPMTLRQNFRKASLPLMPLTNILSFNTRAICIYVTCLLNCPWAYFVFEIVVLGPMYLYMHWKHENISKNFLDAEETKTDTAENKGKAVVFDFGGTLDTGGCHWARVLYKAYRNVGVDVTWEDFKEVYVATERKMESGVVQSTDTMREMLSKKIATHNLHGDILDEVYDKVLGHAQKSRAVLLQLKQRVQLAVVSNFYGNLQTVLEELNLADLFSVVIDSTVVGVRKPDARIFSMAIEQLGVLPQNVTVVGDSIKNDILPAQQLGCKTVWVKGEAWEDKPSATAHQSTAEITDINQLMQVIGKIYGDDVQ